MLHTINISKPKLIFLNGSDSTMRGEEFIIAKAGKPVARLIPIEPEKPVRRPGALKGKIKIADDFDAPLPADLLDAFEDAKCAYCSIHMYICGLSKMTINFQQQIFNL